LEHKDLAALRLAEDVLEQGSDLVGVNLVEDLAHLGVAGDGHKAKDSAEVVVQRATLEGEQRRVLEGEQGKTGHQGVGQREGGTATLVWDLLKALASQLYQSVKVEVFALLPR
jgi:hypothetical protein